MSDFTEQAARVNALLGDGFESKGLCVLIDGKFTEPQHIGVFDCKPGASFEIYEVYVKDVDGWNQEVEHVHAGCVSGEAVGHLSDEWNVTLDLIMELDEAEQAALRYKQSLEALVKQRVPLLRKDISKKYATTFLSILRRDGSACRICGQPSADLQIDHIQPVSRGGGNDFANLQLLCPTCNSAKRNNWLEGDGAE